MDDVRGEGFLGPPHDRTLTAVIANKTICHFPSHMVRQQHKKKEKEEICCCYFYK